MLGSLKDTGEVSGGARMSWHLALVGEPPWSQSEGCGPGRAERGRVRPHRPALPGGQPQASLCLSLPSVRPRAAWSLGHRPIGPALLSDGWPWPGSYNPPSSAQQSGRLGQLGLVPGTPAVRKPPASHPNISWCRHPPAVTGSAELRAAVARRGWGGGGARAPPRVPSCGQQGLAPLPGAHTPTLLRRSWADF